MHFLCSTYGSSGDVFPMLGLALELRSRGHEVTFATNQHYEALARSYGLPFEALGTEEDFSACVNSPDLWKPGKAFRHVFETGVRPSLVRQYEIHAERVGSGDLVGVTNCFGFGVLTAQDKYGFPAVTLHCQPTVIWSDRAPPALPGLFGPRWMRRLQFRIAERFVLDPIVCPSLNQWRRGLGLPPVRSLMRWWNSPRGVLCLFPEWYAKPQDDWPRPLLQTDFPLWNRSAEVSDSVRAFLDAGDAPIVFTPGSTNVHARPFFEAAIEACRTLGRRGIFLTEFPDQLPGNLPESIAHFDYVPLDHLLPRAVAFVHHGGIGSASQGMLAGIPQVLMPLAHDQFDNAARLRGLGVGDALPANRFTGAQLGAALKTLVDSTEVARSCKVVASRLEKRDGLSRAADALEGLVREPRAK